MRTKRKDGDPSRYTRETATEEDRNGFLSLGGFLGRRGSVRLHISFGKLVAPEATTITLSWNSRPDRDRTERKDLLEAIADCIPHTRDTSSKI